MSENISTPSSNPIESGAVSDEVSSMEEAVHDTESLELSDSSDSSESVDSSSVSTQSTDAEASAAADKIKAKEVKGSDGELFKIKVGGEELQLKREEMIRLAQMGKAGQKAMQEKAELQKSMGAFIEALKANPELVLREDLGLDVTKLAQEVLSRQLEEESLDPREKELRDLKAQLERINKEKEEEKTNRENQEFEQEVARYEQELETQVQEAFESNNLPRKPVFLHRMADLLEEAYNRNLNVSPKQIAAIIKQDWLSETKNALSAFDDDQLEGLLGTEIMTRMRKHGLKKVKAAPTIGTKTAAESVKPQEIAKKSEKISWKDFVKTRISE